MAFYSNNLDSIGFVDMKYYDGRDKDNVFPSQLAAAMGYNNYVTQLNSEGGNLMTDGFGKMFFSSVVVAANADPSNHSTPWTKAQTYDTIRQIFNTPELIDLTTLDWIEHAKQELMDGILYLEKLKQELSVKK